MPPVSRRSSRTPTHSLETASLEQLNSGSSYRVQHDGETFSITANTVNEQVYYYVTKRVRGKLHKMYLGKCGEVTPERLRIAIAVLLTEMLALSPGKRHKGASHMRGQEMGVDEALLFDLLDGLDLVATAPLEEQKDLYDAWRDSTSRTLALVLPPDQHAAWEAFSAQDVEWNSERKAALHLQSERAFLRAVATAPQAEEEAVKRNKGRIRFNRLTRRARQVLVLAQTEAQRLRHDHVGTEHLLLALAQKGVSSEVLGALGVTADRVLALIEGRADRGATPVDSYRTVLTGVIKHTIECAVREAQDRGHRYIDTTHMLLALAQQEESAAAQLLHQMGVPPETVCEETRLRMESGPGGSTGEQEER